MTGGSKTTPGAETVQNWVVELVLPGLSILLLGACLLHIAYSALHAQSQPVAGFQYAISAFAL